MNELILKSEQVLSEHAEQYCPEGTEPRALVHQWLHAIAHNTPLFAESSGVEKKSLIKTLKFHNLYKSKEEFKASLQEGFNLLPSNNPSFTFIDLFAGIGGVRLGFQENKGVCVFSSEFDKHAQDTYFLNHGEYPFGDITQISPEVIPDHDVLLAGFPCQAFSVAGHRQGFDDEKGRGNLFFNIYDVLKEKKPKAFLLENVKNLKGHDKGNTYQTIKKYLNDLGYSVMSNVLNSMDYGNVPQNRERIYIVGFKGEQGWKNQEIGSTASSRFSWPEPLELTVSIRDILDENVGEEFYYEKFKCHEQLKEKMTNKNTVYQWRRVYVRENKNNVCPTLTANMGTGGHNVPLILDEKNRIRKLTPIECSRIQGFPNNFLIGKLANSHAYKQFGNSVTAPVIKRISEELMKALNSN